MPAGAPAQTIRQAKASFVARSRPSLSDQQERQLRRDLVLERRAQQVRDQEKRKAEAAQRRSERERREKLELERRQLSSQRRCDRYGHKSSQLHLGAYLRLGVRTANAEDITVQVKRPLDAAQDDDLFEDGGVDDGMLLAALNSPSVKWHLGEQTAARTASNSALMPPPPLPCTTSRAELFRVARSYLEIGFEDCWAELQSGTQIARELQFDQPSARAQFPEGLNGSFSSSSFSISSEDLSRLDVEPSNNQTHNLIQPSSSTRGISNTTHSRHYEAPDATSTSQLTSLRYDSQPFQHRSALPETGITLTQLEKFAESEVQFTPSTPS